MTPRRVVVLVTLALLAATPAMAAQFGAPLIQTVGDAESIPDNNVSALAEDGLGFLWIGSPNGLLRYDGYRFQPYSGTTRDGKTLGRVFVRTLRVGTDGRLWVGTDADGLWVHSPATGHGQRFRHDPASPDSLASDSVFALAEDPLGGFWVGTRAGLDYLPLGANTFMHFRSRSTEHGGLGDARIFSLQIDRSGDLWVGTGTALYRRRAGTTIFEAIHSDAGRADPLAGQRIESLFSAADGRLWVGLDDGRAFVIDPESLQLTAIGPDQTAQGSGSGTMPFAQPDPAGVWMGRRGGIDVLASDTGRLRQQFRYDPATTTGLAGNDLRALLVDRSGQLWLGGFGTGLQRLDPRPGGIRVLRHHPTRRHALSFSSINSVLELDTGEIWVGTRGNGIDILSRQHELIDHLRLVPNALENARITAMAQTADRNIWIADDDTLWRADPLNRSVRQYSLPPGLENTGVRCLTVDRRGQLWIGTDAGLARWRHDQDRIDQIEIENDEPAGNINIVAEAPDGRLWVGSAYGLFTLSPGGSRLTAVRTRPDRPGLAHTSIVGLLLDRRGRLWIDTSRGLSRMRSFDGRFAEFETVGAEQGIGGQPFGANLLEDASGRLWSPRFVLDPEKNSIYPLTKADGVDFGTSWFRAYSQSRDGVMWFGGSAGLLVIDPIRFQPWRYAPPVRGTELKINGVPVQGAEFANTLTLTPEQRAFSLEFSALDFTAPERNRYRYRLLGYDPDWIATDAGHRVASYSNLWPGIYTLKVQGSNRNGDWSPHELRMTVTVLPAFWQTAWFAGLALLAVAGTGYAGVRWRTARLRQNAARLEALVQARTTDLQRTHAELQSAHHELLGAQQQLVTQEKLASLGTLTAGVAHEINNPTNFISGAAQNLSVLMRRFQDFLRRLAGDDADPQVMAAIDREFKPQYEQLETILDGALRISRIVGDLRQFTRLDEATRKRIRIGEPIQSTVNLIRTRYDRIAFELELAANPEIDCQPAKLGQVFMNLVVNACEATAASDRPGWVRISTARTATDVMVHVDDNGPGMDEATRQRVFEPFFTTKEVGKGTGLGLSISLGIVREHGGEIEVETQPGQGCRFTVRLPIAGAGGHA